MIVFNKNVMYIAFEVMQILFIGKGNANLKRR